MHILKIIHGYPPQYNAGSEVYSQSICNELAKTHQVTVFTREENLYLPDFHIRKKEGFANPQIYLVNMVNSKDGFRHTALDEKFRQLVRSLRPDVAHIGHLNHLSTGLLDVLKEEEIPVLFTLHDFWLMCPRGQFLQRSLDEQGLRILCEKQDNRACACNCYTPYFTGKSDFYNEDVQYWTDWINARMQETRSIIEKCDHFIAPSRYLVNRFAEDFSMPADKIEYLDYGFPLHYLTPSTQKEKADVFSIGYIGTHIPAKGINLLIRAFSNVTGNARLLIWGRQTDPNLLEMARKDSERIRFMGEYMNHNLADEVFSKVDAIVVPSIWGENSPLVIHEAQACRVPVITADFGGMAEYVQHMANGLLFRHRNTESLKEQLQWAIDHPAEMKRLGQRGYLRDAAGKVPGIEEHCERLLAVYHQIRMQYA